MTQTFLKNTNRSLRIAIVGAGNLGVQHAAAAHAYGASVVAVFDPRREVAQSVAAPHSATAVQSLEQLFDHDLDGLIVATPPPSRLEPIRFACERSVHLFVEKPPALDLATGRECLRYIEQAGVLAATGFQLRYDPRYQTLKELMSGHEVHLVRTVCTVGYYLDFQMAPWFLQKPVSGGPIAEQAIHLLDCVRWLFDNAKGTRALAAGVKNMAPDRPEFDAENALQMLWQLDNGVIAVHSNHCGHERFCFDLEVIGPHLRLQANITQGTVHGIINGEKVDVTPPAAPLGRLEAWLRAIETGDANLIRSPYADALHTQSLVDAAIRSQTSNMYEAVEQT